MKKEVRFYILIVLLLLGVFYSTLCRKKEDTQVKITNQK